MGQWEVWARTRGVQEESLSRCSIVLREAFWVRVMGKLCIGGKS